MVNKKLLLSVTILLAVVILTAAYRRPYAWWPVNDMAEQPIIKPYHTHGLRAPVEGTQALESWDPVPPKMEVEQNLHPDLQNPIAATEASIKKGQDLYKKYCWPCHGDGMKPGEQYQSPVMKKGMPGANLIRVSMLSDSTIFATITHGNAIMKRMDYHLSPEERWHVVNYVRQEIEKFKAEQQ